MLTRFTIKNVGRFFNCTLNGSGREFREKTIVFGDNGNGKSTLTAVMRSCESGDNYILIGRKSFGSQDDKEVIFNFSDGTHCDFRNKQWASRPTHRFYIFDDKFIAENVFDASGITDEHRVNIHRVVVGSEGMTLVKAVHDVELQISQAEKQQRLREQQYNLSKPDNALSLADFLSLPHDLTIDVAISEKSNELRFASQIDKHKELTFRDHEFSAAKEILSRNFSTMHKEAASKIAVHVQHISGSTGFDYNFLQNGFAIHAKSSNNACPMCGQDTASVDELFRAYAAYFDEQYKDHQDKVRSLQSKVQRWNVEHEFDTLHTEATSWAVYFSNKTILELFIQQIGELRGRVATAKAQFEVICQQKIEDPAAQVDIASVEALEQLWVSLTEVVHAFNTHISLFVQQVGVKNRLQIESELSRLRAQKVRHDQKWKEFCDTYEESCRSIDSLKQRRDEVLQKLSTYSVAVFAAHQHGINEVLAHVGADFRVHDLGEKRDLRKSQAVYCGFDLKFFEQHVVPITSTAQDASFSNTLSGGDKSALAFAFFVSVLQNTQDLSKAIIVFDDPISSFDRNRRRATVHALAQIKDKSNNNPAQCIILTHDEGFLRELIADARFADATLLEIIKDGVTGTVKKSAIRAYDREKLLPSEFGYFKQIEGWLAHTEVPENATEVCRKLLEAVFHVKYYRHLEEQIRAQASVTKYTQTLVEKGVYTQDYAQEFLDFFPQIHDPHHHPRTDAGDGDSTGDLQFTLRRTLELVEKV